MTIAEHQEFAQIERTCDEVRKDNIDLQAEIHSLHKDLCQIIVLNSLGKTKEIADLAHAIVTNNSR